MPRKTKNPAKNRTSEATFSVSESDVREIVETTLRNELSTQAREMEKHLTSIHERLVALESR
jgi:hypothetical protein